MTTHAKHRARHKAGAPASVGGQFKGQENPLADEVDLDQFSDFGGDDGMFDQVEPQPQAPAAHPLVTDEMVGALPPRELLDFARAAARRATASMQIPESADDMAALGIQSYIKHVRKVDPAQLSAGVKPPATVTDHRRARAYINQVIDRQTTRAKFNVVSSDDMAGHRLLREEIERIESSTGEKVTAAQRDELAEKVRMSDHFKPRHRPTKGFHLRTASVSLDMTDDEGQSWMHDKLAAEERDDGAFVPGSKAAEIMIQLGGDRSRRGGPRVDRAAARDQAWAAMAEVTGAPVPTERITEVRAATIRTTVRDAGGVQACMRRWDAGIDCPGSEAIFSVFGDIDVDTRDAVSETLMKVPGRSDQLFDSVVTTLSRRAR